MFLANRHTVLADQIIKFAQEPICPALTASEGALRTSMELLDSYWHQFEGLNLSMQQTIREDEARAALEDIRTRTQELYIKAKGELYNEQSRIGSSPSHERSVASVQLSNDPRMAGSVHLQPQVIYRHSQPKIPKFSGDPKEWETFRDLYRAGCHTRQDLAPVQKFFELHGALEGKAKDAIKAFQINDADYSAAWQALLDRFDKPEILATQHVDALFELKRLTEETPQGLQGLYDNVNSHVEAIKFLGESLDWRVHAVRRAMDPQTKRAWVEETQKNAAAGTYEGLKTFLKQRISALTTLGSQQTPSTSSQASKRHRSNDGRSSRVLAVTSSVKCDLCAETHPTYKCEELRSRTPGERFRLIEQRRLCFNCLRGGHSSRSCPSGRRCLTCERRHHSMLHEDKKPRRNPSGTVEGRSQGVLTTKNAQSTSPQES